MDMMQILFLFFGLPLAILGLGIRRGLGPRRVLALLLLGTAAGLYGAAVEWLVRASGRGLPLPVYHDWQAPRVLAAFWVPTALVGALGSALLRTRGLPPSAAGSAPPGEPSEPAGGAAGGEERP